MFKFDLFRSDAKYFRGQFLLGASSSMLRTTDWNLRNPDSVFMESMRILSISMWAVAMCFGATLARRPRGVCSTSRREAADRIRKIYCFSYCDAIGILLQMLKSLITPALFQKYLATEYRSDGVCYEIFYNYKRLRDVYNSWEMELWIFHRKSHFQVDSSRLISFRYRIASDRELNSRWIS